MIDRVCNGGLSFAWRMLHVTCRVQTPVFHKERAAYQRSVQLVGPEWDSRTTWKLEMTGDYCRLEVDERISRYVCVVC